MNSDNRWGPLEYLTLGGIVYITYKIISNAWKGVILVVSMLRWVLMYLVTTWMFILIYCVYNVTPAWVIALFFVALGTFLFLIGYNTSIADKKNKESLRLQQVKFEEDLSYLQKYLSDLDFHYYDYEKKAFETSLVERGMVNFFRYWDEAYRLQQIGNVTGKFYVCDLTSMTSEQLAAKRNAAWDKKRDEQRTSQLKKNAEAKARKRAQI